MPNLKSGNPEVYANRLSPPLKHNIHKGGTNINDFHSELLTGKQEGPSSSSPGKSASSPSTHTALPPIPVPCPKRPYDEAVADIDTVRCKLRHALRGIIPHKVSLKIQAQVVYTVDEGRKDVIVIDETFNQTKQDLPATTATSSVLDLSQKPEEASFNPSTSGNGFSSQLSAPTMPLVNFPLNQSAPPGFPPQTLYSQLLQIFIASSINPLVNLLPPTLNPSGLSSPMGLPYPPTYFTTNMPIEPFSAIAPNATITNSDNALTNSQLGATNRPTLSIRNTNHGGSLNSFPLSNHGSSSLPTMAPKSLSRAPSQASCSIRRSIRRRLICNQCRDWFISHRELEQHTLRDHGTFKCTYCGRTFTQKSNLQRHSMRHLGFMPFVCNICNYGISRRDHLVRHIVKKHPGVNPQLNTITHLRPADCLEFLDMMRNSSLTIGIGNGSSNDRSTLNETHRGPENSLAKADEGSTLTNEDSTQTPPAREGTTLSEGQDVEQPLLSSPSSSQWLQK